jgi:hypothetical protein
MKEMLLPTLEVLSAQMVHPVMLLILPVTERTSFAKVGGRKTPLLSLLLPFGLHFMSFPYVLSSL